MTHGGLKTKTMKWMILVLNGFASIGARRGVLSCFSMVGSKTELQDCLRSVLEAGMSYQVADNAGPHRSITKTGALAQFQKATIR